jgi:hypothetical protein
MKLIGIILAIVCIFAAFYELDIHNINSCIVSVLLLMTAFLTLVPNRKITEHVRYAAVFLAVFLLMKILISG